MPGHWRMKLNKEPHAIITSATTPKKNETSPPWGASPAQLLHQGKPSFYSAFNRPNDYSSTNQ